MRIWISHGWFAKRSVVRVRRLREIRDRAVLRFGHSLGFAILAAATPVLAADDSIEVTSGRVLAEKWCAECHVPGSASKGRSGVAPSFRAVANDPATTERSVRVFLRSPHPTMPNIALTREQVDDIVAYILSFKER